MTELYFSFCGRWLGYYPRCLAIANKTEFKQEKSLRNKVFKEKVKDKCLGTVSIKK